MSPLGQSSSWKRYSIYLVMWTLLIMTLMRLVWMQRRPYEQVMDLPARATIHILEQERECEVRHPLSRQDRGLQWHTVLNQLTPEVQSWFAVIGLKPLWASLCNSNLFDADKAVRINQWTWVAVVFFCTLAIRLLGFNWLVCLVVATTLMSRGRFIAMNAVIGTEMAAALIQTLGFCLIILFMRSSSWLAFAMLLVVGTLGVLIDKSFISLLCVMPLMALGGRWIGKARLVEAGPITQQYSHWSQLLRDREESWDTWNQRDSNWLKVCWWSGITLLIAGFYVIMGIVLTYESVFGDIHLPLMWERFGRALQNYPWQVDLAFIREILDNHFFMSLFFVFLYSFKVNPHPFLRLCSTALIWLFVISMLLIFGFRSLDLMFFNGQIPAFHDVNIVVQDIGVNRGLFWSEPLIISLGVGCLWSLVFYDVRAFFRPKV